MKQKLIKLENELETYYGSKDSGMTQFIQNIAKDFYVKIKNY